MKDTLHKLLKWIDHNRWSVIVPLLALVIAVGVGLLAGCESATASLLQADREVNRTELAKEAATIEADLAAERARLDAAIAAYNAEVAATEKKLAAAEADLDRQDQIKASILQTVGATLQQAATGQFNWPSLIPAGLGVVGLAWGVGTKLDNKRKDQVILSQKAGQGGFPDGASPATT